VNQIEFEKQCEEVGGKTGTATRKGAASHGECKVGKGSTNSDGGVQNSIKGPKS
jgi:hypothetical protein